MSNDEIFKRASIIWPKQRNRENKKLEKKKLENKKNLNNHCSRVFVIHSKMCLLELFGINA